MPHKDPFVIKLKSVPDRLAVIKTFTPSECMDALALDDEKPYLQRSVRSSIEGELLELSRAEKADLAKIRAGAGAA